MKDIYEVSAACSTKTYIWGGFTIDIMEGRFKREHGDLDGFVVNMMAIVEDLIEGYRQKGYSVEFREGINMLVIRKDGRHAGFNPLDIDGSVAMWRHIGDRGTVYFPFNWLDTAPQCFYDVRVYSSGLCFEYGFRKIAGLLNPKWKEREKDTLAKEYLKEKIIEKGIDPQTISRSIWSYNPIWISKGYDPFKSPVLVCPMTFEET